MGGPGRLVFVVCELSHRVDIPYLAKDTAREVHGFLAAEAAGTELRW